MYCCNVVYERMFLECFVVNVLGSEKADIGTDAIEISLDRFYVDVTLPR